MTNRTPRGEAKDYPKEEIDKLKLVQMDEPVLDAFLTMA